MSRTISVVIVEDSQPMQSAVRDFLATVGPFEVIATAMSETQATDRLQKHAKSWQLLITDLILSDGSGYGVIRRAREGNPDGSIVVFSEFATPAVAQKCKDIGADAIFKKSEMKAFVGFLETLVHQPPLGSLDP